MRNNHKIIRLTLATSFFHSMIAALLILLNLNTLFARKYENGLYVGKIAEFFVNEINKNQVIGWVIAIAIICFIAYSILYPIGQSAIINYLNDNKHSIRNALRKGRKDFFPMFEFGIVSLIISPTVFWLALLQITVSGGLHGGSRIFMLIIRFAVMTIVNGLTIYTRYIVTIEKKGLYDAIIKSCYLTLNNTKESFKYIQIQTILILNFTFNVLIIFAIPIILIYLAIIFNIIQYPAVKWTIYGIFFFGILFGAYASSIIRAFFVYFWQKIYENINK